MFDLTPAHLHLLVNHLPVEGSIFATLLLIYAMIRNNAELKRTSLILLVIVGVTAFVADTTGGGAARVVRKIPGTERAAISEHAKAADFAKIMSGITALVALGGLIAAWSRKERVQVVSTNGNETIARDYVRYHKAPHTAVVVLCLLLSLVSVSVLARVAYLGGKIRHPEINAGFQPPVTADSTATIDSAATAQPH
jgi:hypothetical protein